jgi:formate dehydrogenase subunit beta
LNTHPQGAKTCSTWILETHGDPLGAVRDFVKTIWLESGLDGMLVTINGSNPADSLDLSVKPQFIDDPQRLSEINPFKPLMTVNAARFVPSLVLDHPQAKIGLLLRPCEMRALAEVTRRLPGLTIDHFLTISVDCLGTLPADEYHWRAKRIEMADGLTHEALQFARQGGIVAYRNRSTCQLCSSPEAKGADINIHVLGLPVRQNILVNIQNDIVAEHLQLVGTAGASLQLAPANSNLVAQHERMLAKMTERHQRTMERLKEALGSLLPVDVDAVISQLEHCGECQVCMNVCPICSLGRPTRSQDGHYERSEVINWLVSCAGCGMCEQSCPSHLPLSIIFTHIHQQLISTDSSIH